MGNNQNQKPTLRKMITKEIRIALATGLPAIISYAGVFSHPSYYAPCTDKSESYRWAFANWIFSIVHTGISCLLIPLFWVQIYRFDLKNEEKEVKKWKIFMGIIKLILLICTFVNYFGICAAYSTGENCSHLTKLILSFIIIFPIVFVVIFTYRAYMEIKKRKAEKEKKLEKEENNEVLIGT